MSRAIEAFLNGRLLAGLAAAIVLSVLLTPLLARRLRITRPAAYLSALAGLLIIAFTIFERLAGLPGFDPGQALTWWTEIRQSPIEVARTEPAWRLNVALFVPAGIVWSVVTKRPLATAAALFGFSFGIETLQALTGLGAADVTDLSANVIGGVIGATVIAAAMRFAPGVIPDAAQSASIETDGGLGSKWVLAIVGATLLSVGALYGGIQAVLTIRQNTLRDEIETTYSGMKVEDVNTILEEETIGLNPFFILEAGAPDSYQFYGDSRPIEIRYPIDFLGFYRCVFVMLSDSAPVFSESSGDECTEDRFPE